MKQTQSNKTYIFCYGTLMSYNPHSVMYELGAKKIDIVMIKNYQLYLNFGNFLFPSIVKGHGKGRELFAEVWEVNQSLIPYIDQYEQVSSGLYTRDEITVGKYRGFIYRMKKVTKGMVPIALNDWRQFLYNVGDKLSIQYQSAYHHIDSLSAILKDESLNEKTKGKYTNLYNNAIDKYWNICDKIEQYCR